MIRLLSRDGHQRSLVVRALGDLGDERAIEPLFELFATDYGPSEWLDVALGKALEQLGATKEQLGEAYLKALENSNSIVQREATRALVELRDRRAIEPLIQLGVDNSLFGNNSRNFFKALEKIGATKEQMLKAAIKGLVSSREEDRLVSAEKLGDLGDKRAVNPLIKRLNDVHDVRIEVARSLGKIGDERAINPLTNLLNDKLEDVHKVAEEALNEIS